MKKGLLMAIMAALVFMACRSGPGMQPSGALYAPGEHTPETPEAPKGSKNVWETIDDKGASMGVSAPAWIASALQNDITAIKKDPRFEGKTLFIFDGYGQDLDLTRSWVNNFNAGGEISRQISTKVNGKFEGGLQGAGNAAKLQQLKEVVATLSRTQVSGLAREMDWWTLRRNRDTGQEQYRYIVVYSIDKDILRHQIDTALGKVSARAAEEKELVEDMHKALSELEFDEIVNAGANN
jgi:hypothetical protein